MGAGDQLEVTRTGGASAPWLGGGAPPPPDRVGPYQLLGKLGEGGMGVVFAAHHRALDRKVALKLAHQATAGAGGQALALREAQALARLSHPNVVHVYEVGEHEGRLFVAMEHVDGETLEAWQTAPGRTLAEILAAYRQAALGLRAAHEAGLVHRDFKPANAIVGADGRVRVLDFGLARAGGRPRPEAAAGAPAAADPLATQAGGLAGTPAYMSPEQFEGQAVDARSDLFSLCVALYEAIHGERPFAGDTVDALRGAVTRGQRRPPPAAARLPERLRRALDRGLERDPERRFADLGPLIDALAVDPDADPSAAARERGILFAVVAAAIVGVFTPALIAGVVVRDLDPRAVNTAISAAGLALLAALVLALRRPLLGNAYHRRMILFLGALLVVVTSQRTLALRADTPVEVLMTDSAHVVIGMCLVGALSFARWMLVPATILALMVAAAHLWPAAGHFANVVSGPLFMILFGAFWRRDARRLE